MIERTIYCDECSTIGAAGRVLADALRDARAAGWLCNSAGEWCPHHRPIPRKARPTGVTDG